MMTRLPLALLGASLFLLTSCGDPYGSLLIQEKATTADLRATSEAQKDASPVKIKADSLVTASEQSLKNGDGELAYAQLCTAHFLYQKAQATQQSNLLATKIATLESQLAEATTSLNGFKTLLTPNQSQTMEITNAQ